MTLNNLTIVELGRFIGPTMGDIYSGCLQKHTLKCIVMSHKCIKGHIEKLFAHFHCNYFKKVLHVGHLLRISHETALGYLWVT